MVGNRMVGNRMVGNRMVGNRMIGNRMAAWRRSSRGAPRLRRAPGAGGRSRDRDAALLSVPPRDPDALGGRLGTAAPRAGGRAPQRPSPGPSAAGAGARLAPGRARVSARLKFRPATGGTPGRPHSRSAWGPFPSCRPGTLCCGGNAPLRVCVVQVWETPPPQGAARGSRSPGMDPGDVAGHTHGSTRLAAGR
jgi:hypothetical protein